MKHSRTLMQTILDSPSLFVVLSFIYPTVYLLGINSHIYSSGQITVTLIVILFVSVVATVIFRISAGLLIKLFLCIAWKLGLSINVGIAHLKLYRGLLAGIGAAILLILLFSVIQELAFNNILLIFASLLLTICSFILSYFFGMRVFNIILCALILFNCASWGLYSLTKETLRNNGLTTHEKILFKQKPNVYMIILESYASLDIRKNVYDIDSSLLEAELAQKQYCVYKMYANYASTLPSMASVFSMDHHYYKYSRGLNDGEGYRKILWGAAGNPVVNTFLDNGYCVDFNNFYGGLSSPVFADLETQPYLQPIELFSGIFWFADKVLHSSLRDSDFFRSLLWFPERIIGRLPEPVYRKKSENNTRPVFSIRFSGAEHSPNRFAEYPQEIINTPGASEMPRWKLNCVDDYWVRAYRKSIAQSDRALIELVGKLAEDDPHSMVILIGDHGTYFKRDCWKGAKNDLNENMLDHGIEPLDVTRDLFEVFVAIKWPPGFGRSHEYFSHVNLFRHVFAVLSENNSILNAEVPNDSFMFADRRHKYLGMRNVYRTVKDGVLLDRWEPFAFSERQ